MYYNGSTATSKFLPSQDARRTQSDHMSLNHSGYNSYSPSPSLLSIDCSQYHNETYSNSHVDCLDNTYNQTSINPQYEYSFTSTSLPPPPPLSIIPEYQFEPSSQPCHQYYPQHSSYSPPVDPLYSTPQSYPNPYPQDPFSSVVSSSDSMYNNDNSSFVSSINIVPHCNPLSPPYPSPLLPSIRRPLPPTNSAPPLVPSFHPPLPPCDPPPPLLPEHVSSKKYDITVQSLYKKTMMKSDPLRKVLLVVSCHDKSGNRNEM